MEEASVEDGGANPHIRAHHIKKRALKNKALSVSFNEKDLNDYVTGFHKRKKKRRREAEVLQQEAERRKRIEKRKQRKLEREFVQNGAAPPTTDGIPDEDVEEEDEQEESDAVATVSDQTMRVAVMSYVNDPSAANADSYNANFVLSEGEAIYDYCWYPYMSASDPVTCVFASTTRDHPIHLWDASSGQLRCTYRAYDAMDEITAAFSIGFNPSGTKIFAGYNKTIRIFDIHRPGRDFEQHSTLQGNKEGQSGIISAIAFSPTHTGMLATGSYNQTTAIYREDNMESLYVLHGQEGGVTHVQFSRDGNYLYTGVERILIFFAGIYATLWILFTSKY